MDIRHLDADRPPAGNRCDDADTQRLETLRNIVFEPLYLRDAHPLALHDLVEGHRGARRGVDLLDRDAEAVQNLLDPVLVVENLLIGHLRVHRIVLQQAGRGLSVIDQVLERVVERLVDLGLVQHLHLVVRHRHDQLVLPAIGRRLLPGALLSGDFGRLLRRFVGIGMQHDLAERVLPLRERFIRGRRLPDRFGRLFGARFAFDGNLPERVLLVRSDRSAQRGLHPAKLLFELVHIAPALLEQVDRLRRLRNDRIGHDAGCGRGQHDRRMLLVERLGIGRRHRSGLRRNLGTSEGHRGVGRGLRHRLGLYGKRLPVPPQGLAAQRIDQLATLSHHGVSGRVDRIDEVAVDEHPDQNPPSGQQDNHSHASDNPLEHP